VCNDDFVVQHFHLERDMTPAIMFETVVLAVFAQGPRETRLSLISQPASRSSAAILR
jgi:hypothetical protein